MNGYCLDRTLCSFTVCHSMILGGFSLAILRFVLPSPPLLRPEHLSRQSLKLHPLPGGGRIQRWEHYRLPVAAIRVATAIVTTIRIGGVGT